MKGVPQGITAGVKSAGGAEGHARKIKASSMHAQKSVTGV